MTASNNGDARVGVKLHHLRELANDVAANAAPGPDGQTRPVNVGIVKGWAAELKHMLETGTPESSMMGELMSVIDEAREAAEAYRRRFETPRGLVGPIDEYMQSLEAALKYVEEQFAQNAREISAKLYAAETGFSREDALRAFAGVKRKAPPTSETPVELAMFSKVSGEHHPIGVFLSRAHAEIAADALQEADREGDSPEWSGWRIMDVKDAEPTEQPKPAAKQTGVENLDGVIDSMEHDASDIRLGRQWMSACEHYIPRIRRALGAYRDTANRTGRDPDAKGDQFYIDGIREVMAKYPWCPSVMGSLEAGVRALEERQQKVELPSAPQKENVSSTDDGLSKAERVRLYSIIERDRTIFALATKRMRAEILAREWLVDGRGPYEYDDARYQSEFGDAIKALDRECAIIERINGGLEDCPKDRAFVSIAQEGAVELVKIATEAVAVDAERVRRAGPGQYVLVGYTDDHHRTHNEGKRLGMWGERQMTQGDYPVFIGPRCDGAPEPVGTTVNIEPSVGEVSAKLIAQNSQLREKWTWHENEIERLTQICILLGTDPYQVDPDALRWLVKDDNYMVRHALKDKTLYLIRRENVADESKPLAKIQFGMVQGDKVMFTTTDVSDERKIIGSGVERVRWVMERMQHFNARGFVASPSAMQEWYEELEMSLPPQGEHSPETDALMRDWHRAHATPAEPVEYKSVGAVLNANWEAINKAVDDFLNDYQMMGEGEDGRDGVHVPTEFERALLSDAIHGVLGDHDFQKAFGIVQAIESP